MIFGIDIGKIIESTDWHSDKSSFVIGDIKFEPEMGFSFEKINEMIVEHIVAGKKYIDLRAVVKIMQENKDQGGIA